MRRRKFFIGSNVAALSSTSSWTPASLGANLLEAWDPQVSAGITQSGGLVSSWASSVSGLALLQLTSSKKPAFSLTSFNNQAGVLYDGVDDVLIAPSGGNLPTGAAAGWLWALVDQLFLGTVTGTKQIFGYSGASADSQRALARTPSSNINRAAALIGTGLGVNNSRVNTAIDFSGRHVLLGKWTGTRFDIIIDGNDAGDIAGIPATLGGITVMGASSVNGNAAFENCVVGGVWATNALSAGDEALMTAYLNARNA